MFPLLTFPLLPLTPYSLRKLLAQKESDVDLAKSEMNRVASDLSRAKEDAKQKVGRENEGGERESEKWRGLHEWDKTKSGMTRVYVLIPC